MPEATPVAAPTVAASLSASKVDAGSSVLLSWSATDAESCTIAEVSTATLTSSGNLSVTPTDGGRYRYTVRCMGSGGTVAKSLDLVVPMPVFPTSYENKNSIAFDDTQVPTVRALGLPRVVPTEQDSIDRSVAFGDFFQEGKYSAFVMAGNSDGRWGDDKPGDLPSVGYFLDRNADGQWVDRSSELFKSKSDRMGCVWPSYSAVADFNHDGRPDIYMACTGFDFAVPGATPEENNAYGRSHQVLVLSQPDGAYVSKRIEEANPLYGHKAVAFDINGDGHVDIVTTDFIDPSQPLGCGAPFVLLGRGDGTFKRDYSLIDADALRRALPECGMFNVDMVPVDGRHDLIFGGLTARDSAGHEFWVALWVKATASGFDFMNPRLMSMPMDSASGVRASFALDVVFDTGTDSFYFKTNAALAEGANWLIAKASKNGSGLTVIDSWMNPSAQMQPTSPQFKPSHFHPGVLRAFSGGCSADVTKGDCGRQVPM
jgi:hypothetical protein